MNDTPQTLGVNPFLNLGFGNAKSLDQVSLLTLNHHNARGRKAQAHSRISAHLFKMTGLWLSCWALFYP